MIELVEFMCESLGESLIEWACCWVSDLTDE